MGQNDIQKIVMLYDALQLPVRLCIGDTVVFALPDSQKQTENLYCNLSMDRELCYSAQYPVGEGKERYIYYGFRSGHILIGPVIFSSELSGPKSEKGRTFTDIPAFTWARLIACGALIEELFPPEREYSAKPIGLNPKAFWQEYLAATEHYYSSTEERPVHELEKKLALLIQMGKRNLALLVLREIQSRPRPSLAENQLRSLKNTAICSCTWFARAAIAGGANPKAAFAVSDVLIRAAEGCESAEDLSGLEADMILRFIELVHDTAHSSYSSIVQTTMDLINDNLMQPVSIAGLAEQVYVHPNYLMSRFKQETGETVISYVNRRRAEESTYYLQYGGLPISEIANLFCFCSQSYYTAQFKKYMGVTPHQYAKQRR